MSMEQSIRLAAFILSNTWATYWTTQVSVRVGRYHRPASFPQSFAIDGLTAVGVQNG